MHWRNHGMPPAKLEPLPEGLEVFDEPQISFDVDDKFIVFSAHKVAERPVHDDERRHAFVSVSPVKPLGADRTHSTIVLAMVSDDILLLREVKAPTNLAEIEFALQTPRISLAKHQAIKRVKKHLSAMQELTDAPQKQTAE